MKERRFEVKRINQLAQEYVETSDDTVFERLLMEELEPLISVQLGKKYLRIKNFWDDMKQEVLMYLWKNKESLKVTKSKSGYQFYYGYIRHILSRMVKNDNRDPTRVTSKRGMKISTYDIQRNDVIFFDDLSLKEKIKLGIEQFSDTAR